MNSLLASPVSVLRWPSSGDTDSAFEMFSAREDGENVLLVSASRTVAPDAPGVHLSFVNTSSSQAVKLSLKLAGPPPASIGGTVLTVPSATTAPFHGAVLKENLVAITVPAASVVVLTVHEQWERPCESA